MFLRFLKTYVAVLLLALLVGAIHAGPYIYHALTPGYQGIIMADATDADFYLTLVNKNYENAGFGHDPFSFEYQNLGNPFQYFPIEFALGKIGSVLHLPIEKLNIAMEFLFPALLVLLLYFFALALSGNRLTAFFVSTAMLLGNEIVHPDGINNLFNTFLFRGQFREFLTYSRPVNPEASAIFFFATLWALFSLFRNPRSKRAIFLSGIAVGALLYIYIYSFAFAFALLGMLFLYALITRRWELVLATVASGVLSIVMMVPFLYVNIPLLLHGGATLATPILSHTIIIEKMILLPLFLYALVYVWAWWSRGSGKIGQWAAAFSQKYPLVLLLLITGVVVSNQQVLTGKMIFVQHFHFYTNIPMFLLAMSLLFIEALVFLPYLWRTAAVGGAVFVLAWFAIGVQTASYKAHAAEAARYQALTPLFAYLRQSAPVQSVVFADGYLSTRLTIYTQDFAYGVGGYDAAFGVPQERLIHNYLVMLQLRGVTSAEARTYLYEPKNRQEVGGMIFIGTYWRDLCGSYSCFPDSVLEDLVARYKIFYSQPLLQNMKKYKIDYVLWDSIADSNWQLKDVVEKSVIESGDFKLYPVQ